MHLQQHVLQATKYATDEVRNSTPCWPTWLTFGAVLLFAMQGSLALESADPCRISFRKMVLIVILSVIQIVTLFIAEIATYKNGAGPVAEQLPWLAFLPPYLLFAGLLQIAVDAFCTVDALVQSRKRWVPLSEVRQQVKGPTLRHVCIEVFCLLLPTSLSIAIFGWTQRWWLVTKVWVPVSTSTNAIRAEPIIGAPFAIACTIWSSLTHVVVIGALVLEFVLEVRGGKLETPIKSMSGSAALEEKVVSDVFGGSSISEYSDSDEEEQYELEKERRLRQRCRLLLEMRTGWHLTEDATEIDSYLQSGVPLHLGNVLVGESGHEPGKKRLKQGRIGHTWILYMEQLANVPFLLMFFVAAIKLRDQVDPVSRYALESVADSAVLIALLHVGIGLKNLFWRYSGSGNSSREPDKNDIPWIDLEGEKELRCLSTM